ncbi:FLUCTUATING-LIGHT-ACCLIMATION protein 1, chloroplastic-like [Aristolochia californica]|uniref:FLUCTUATING-LIGHT-ACCLIMATION protein 1, chloroplastic-like n=1 Tax=Aristolochia californica TaxID=171875 RepID=UPI0035E07600
MALASSHQSFLLRTLCPTYRPRKKLKPLLFVSCSSSIYNKEPVSPSGNDVGLAKIAFVTLAAGVLTMGSVHEAVAAKSGGRVGGLAFRSAAPRSSSPRINNSRTNIFINPPVAPPLVGGYGFGSPFYGGWGWYPFSFFVPGPSVAIGVGGGSHFFELLLVLGVVATVIRRFRGSGDDEDDDF